MLTEQIPQSNPKHQSQRQNRCCHHKNLQLRLSHHSTPSPTSQKHLTNPLMSSTSPLLLPNQQRRRSQHITMWPLFNIHALSSTSITSRCKHLSSPYCQKNSSPYPLRSVTDSTRLSHQNGSLTRQYPLTLSYSRYQLTRRLLLPLLMCTRLTSIVWLQEKDLSVRGHLSISLLPLSSHNPPMSICIPHPYLCAISSDHTYSRRLPGPMAR
jgi:hypothetical protein